MKLPSNVLPDVTRTSQSGTRAFSFKVGSNRNQRRMDRVSHSSSLWTARVTSVTPDWCLGRKLGRNSSLSSVKTFIQQTGPCFLYVGVIYLCYNITVPTLHKNVHLVCLGLITALPSTELKSCTSLQLMMWQTERWDYIDPWLWASHWYLFPKACEWQYSLQLR